MSIPWLSWLMHRWYVMRERRAIRAVARFKRLAAEWYDRAMRGGRP